MEEPVLLLHHVVIEFPENPYSLDVRRDASSGYELATMRSSWRTEEADLFRWFRNMKSSSSSGNGAQVVSAMIEVFRENADKLFATLREYILLECMVQTSYQLLLDDSELVKQQLDLMYECWFAFGPFHTKAILGRQPRKPCKSAPHILEYVLEHARRMKLRYKGERMVDVSVYSSVRRYAVFLAADSWCNRHLLMYLQYGARIEDLYQDPRKSLYQTSCPMTEALRKLIKYLTFRLPDLIDHFVLKEVVTSKDIRTLQPDLRCLCLTIAVFLRAVRRVKPLSLDMMVREVRERNNIVLTPCRDVIDHPLVRALIPKLSQRYESPEELKHVCRWTIRKRLNENWQLPAGISSLPLPTKLQRYLNLLID